MRKYRIIKTHSRAGMYGHLAQYFDPYGGELNRGGWSTCTGQVHDDIKDAHEDIRVYNDEPDTIVWTGEL